MFGSTVLEVGVGLVFVYWILGLLCSTINEQVIVPLFKLRATFLEEGIKNMLTNLQGGKPPQVSPQGDKPAQSSSQGSNLVEDLYNNHLIQGLSRKVAPGNVQKPSYIPGDTFALALMSLDAVKAYKDTGTATTPIPEALKSLLDKARNDPAAKNDPAKVLATELASIEKWYNDAMDRVTGWYKRRVQLIIFLMGLVIVVALNVDTISLITNLSNNTAQRAAIVSAAQGATNAQNNATNVQNNTQTIQNNIKSLQPFIGWSSTGPNSTLPVPADFWGWVYWILYKIVGLLATILAVSLGAPFWFDLLNKFMAFRSSGPVPQPRTGPSESTGTSQQLAITVTNASPNTPPPGAGVNG
jgi:hypothetical protein